jgi:hypothetical protein
MTKNPENYLRIILKSKIFWYVLKKILHIFHKKFVKFQRILAYISKILKIYFWQENILSTFKIRITNPTKWLIYKILLGIMIYY